MTQPRQPDDSRGGRPLGLERLEELLDAYGAAPERWPEAEREEARRLIEESAVARARWEEAAELDRWLDSLPAASPSAALAARVLAAAPRRPARVWRRALAAAVPLAAAAAVTLWVMIGQKPAPDITAAALENIGVYVGPTDVLLTEPYGIEVQAAVPAIGCADSELGCPNVPGSSGPSSRHALGRVLA